MTELLIIILSTAWFSLAFAVKGGFASTLEPISEARDDSSVLFHALGSKALSAAMMIGYVAFMATFFQTHIGISGIEFKYSLAALAIAWGLICAQRPWPEYSFLLNDPDSPYNHPRGGLKDCLTVLTWRGMAAGGLLTLVTGYIPFICFGMLMPVAVYVCLRHLNHKVFKKLSGWTLSEWAIGALCFGIPMGFYVAGLV